MTRTQACGITAALLSAIAIATAACTGGPREAAQTTPQPAPPPGEQGDLAAIARARADSARHPYTAADVHFMSAMIGHHAQAIEMAALAPTNGASGQLRTLAARIANGQRDEIAIMQQWLRDRQQPVPEASATGMTMMHHGAGHEMLMPGMLSAAQMRELREARGTEFDRLFLTFMIQHHRGAVAMVDELFGSYGAGQDEAVFRLATDVNVDQLTEIARMQRMLLALEFGITSP